MRFYKVICEHTDSTGARYKFVRSDEGAVIAYSFSDGFGCWQADWLVEDDNRDAGRSTVWFDAVDETFQMKCRNEVPVIAAGDEVRIACAEEYGLPGCVQTCKLHTGCDIETAGGEYVEEIIEIAVEADDWDSLSGC